MISLVRKIVALCVGLVLTALPTISVAGAAAPISRCYGYSFNWSGYAIVVGGEVYRTGSGNKYWMSTPDHPIYSYTVSYVYGEWVVPEINPGTTGFLADVGVWIGIDGYDSGTVEQVGTSSEYNPYTGEVTYSAWWEVYPKFSHRIKAMSVNAGDHVAASVEFIPIGKPGELDRGIFVLSLTNKDTGESFTIKQGPLQPGFYQRSSAEWVVERPMFYSPSTKEVYFAELPQFESPIVFFNCQATVTAPSGITTNYDRMWMAAPFPPGYGYGDAYGTSTKRYTIAETDRRSGDLIDGGSFTVTWVDFGTKRVKPWPGRTPE